MSLTRDPIGRLSSGAVWSRPRLRRGVLVTSLAVAAVVVAALAYRSRRPAPGGQLRSATETLAAGLDKERPIEPRLSGFPHLPLRPMVRSGEGAEVPVKLEAAIARVMEGAPADGSAGELAARGTAQLLRGDWDAAVRDLERAAALGEDADVLNNLAAAHLARWLRTAQVVDDRDASLLCAERALALQPDHEGALFNRALALEDPKAADGWRRYLERDGGSAWAAEARAHLTPSTTHSVPSQRE